MMNYSLMLLALLVSNLSSANEVIKTLQAAQIESLGQIRQIELGVNVKGSFEKTFGISKESIQANIESRLSNAGFKVGVFDKKDPKTMPDGVFGFNSEATDADLAGKTVSIHALFLRPVVVLKNKAGTIGIVWQRSFTGYEKNDEKEDVQTRIDELIGFFVADLIKANLNQNRSPNK